jgi:hypothetical protein
MFVLCTSTLITTSSDLSTSPFSFGNWLLSLPCGAVNTSVGVAVVVETLIGVTL